MRTPITWIEKVTGIFVLVVLGLIMSALFITAPFRRAVDYRSLFDELALAQGFDDLAERIALDPKALRKGK